jgi:hypothetical protein
MSDGQAPIESLSLEEGLSLLSVVEASIAGKPTGDQLSALAAAMAGVLYRVAGSGSEIERGAALATIELFRRELASLALDLSREKAVA